MPKTKPKQLPLLLRALVVLFTTWVLSLPFVYLAWKGLHAL